MKHIFVINPHAGKRSVVEEVSSQIADVQALNKYDMEVVFTNDVDDVIALMDRLDQNEEYRFYACGGDGTLHEMVRHCIHKENFTLIPIPVGSGNDFVRTFGIPKTEYYKIENMMNSKRFLIDTIKVGPHHCMNTASVGLDATIGDMTNKMKKRKIMKGSLGYTLSFIGSLATKISFPMNFKVDDHQMPDANYNFVVAANGRYYGGGFKAAPEAVLDDGLLDVVTIDSVNRRTMVKLAPKYREGKHLSYTEFIKYQKAKVIQFESEEEMVLNLDGEIKRMKSPRIEVVPSSLYIVIPEVHTTGKK